MDLNSKEFPGIDSNRNDYLSQLLDEKFNGRTSIGTDDDLSKLNLMVSYHLSQIRKVFLLKILYAVE